MVKKVKVLVLYDSLTGNVETMARAVAEGAEEAGAIVVVKKVDEVDLDDLPKYDGFAFGSPTHCGTMSTRMNEFFNHRAYKCWGKLKYRVATAFTSSGGVGGGNEMTLLSIISTIMNYGMLTFGIPDYVSSGVTLHYGAVAIGKPKKASLRACRLLGRRLVEHANVVKAGLSAMKDQVEHTN